MSQTRTVTLNGQKVVLTRDPESITGHGYEFAQQDGTRGKVSVLGVQMQGPSVLKLSAALLKRKRFPLVVESREITGATTTSVIFFNRTVKADGTIVWQENNDTGMPDDQVQLDTMTFFKDTMNGLGIWVAKAYLNMLDAAWGST